MAELDPDRCALERILREAGEVALAAFRRESGWLKADGTQVSDADLRVEALLVQRLREAFPGTAVRSEEGTRVEGGDGTWYVDPIDGTSAYLDGLAHWGPTVCLVREGRVELGALWLPRLGDMYYARRGHGAWRGAARLRGRAVDTVGRHGSLFAPSRFHRRVPLSWPGKVRALGSSAAHLALVAEGVGLATIVPDWKLWDVGAGVLMIEEAGLEVRDPLGQRLDLVSARPGLPFLAGARTALDLLSADGWPSRASG